MNLLPKNIHGFADKTYWDDFFSKSSEFEWYGEYLQLCGIFHKYMRTNDKILVIGCGNSNLSADLYDAGFLNNINIDISDTVIKQMTNKFGKIRPKMKFLKMDAKEMTFPPDEFNVVLDKGTLDALLVDSSAESSVLPMMKQVEKVLRLGGRYIVVSLLQGHVLNFLLKWVSDNGWIIRIHSRITSALEENIKTLPVFVVVCTKMKKLPGINQILEFSPSEDSSPERKESVDSLRQCVEACQQYAYVCHHINSKKFLIDEASVDLYDSSLPQPRYRLFVLDNSKKEALKFAVFIVPQGRETEWIFGSSEGRRQLLDTIACQRLLVVHLSRGHSYSSLDLVKEELSQRVSHFQPPGITSKDQSPFLSVEGHIGIREVLHEGKSASTGDFVIEDVVSDEGMRFRRLVFLSNQHVIQSEAKLKSNSSGTSKKGRKACTEANMKADIDHSYLACDHHKHMIAGLGFLSPSQIGKEIKVLIIGLGGGGLPSYLQKFLPSIVMDVVEIDPTIVSIAKKWFGLVPNNHLNLFVNDGLNFIKNSEKDGNLYDIVMFDVNNEDSTSGLSVPPPAFVEKNVLESTSKILTHNGFFILNLACRNESLKKSIYSTVSSVFKTIWYQKVSEDVNEVLYCSLSDSFQDSSHFHANVSKLNEIMKRNSQKKKLLDSVELLKSLSILS